MAVNTASLFLCGAQKTQGGDQDSAMASMRGELCAPDETVLLFCDMWLRSTALLMRYGSEWAPSKPAHGGYLEGEVRIPQVNCCKL